MFEKLKTYLRRRRIALLAAELARVRALRVSMTRQEFALRDKLDRAEAAQ